MLATVLMLYLAGLHAYLLELGLDCDLVPLCSLRWWRQKHLPCSYPALTAASAARKASEHPAQQSAVYRAPHL